MALSRTFFISRAQIEGTDPITFIRDIRQYQGAWEAKLTPVSLDMLGNPLNEGLTAEYTDTTTPLLFTQPADQFLVTAQGKTTLAALLSQNAGATHIQIFISGGISPSIEGTSLPKHTQHLSLIHI